MALESKNLDNGADEVVTVDRCRLAFGSVGEYVAWKLTAEPGWRWSEDLKPLEGTDSCEGDHLMFILSGRMGTRLDGGAEVENGPGDAVRIPPGHDAWTVGDEPLVAVGVDPGQ